MNNYEILLVIYSVDCKQQSLNVNIRLKCMSKRHMNIKTHQCKVTG